MSPSPLDGQESYSSPSPPSYSSMSSIETKVIYTSQPQNNSLTPSQNSPKTSLRFCISDFPPYKIIITGKEGNINNLHPIAIGRLLYKNKVPSPNSLKKISRNNILITFSNYKEANSFLDNEVNKTNFNSYIPYNAIAKQGVIRNIPLEISEEEIKGNIKSHYEVLSVRRLNRRVQIEEGGLTKINYVPSKTILLTFRSNKLPDKVYLFSNSLPVLQYQQPITQCKNCLRYGHTYKNCKSKIKRCPACQENHDITECSLKNNPVCLFCKGNHLANDRGCVEKSIQLEARQLATKDNLLLAEALKIKRNEIKEKSKNIHSNPTINARHPLPNPYSENTPTTSRNINYQNSYATAASNDRKRPRIYTPQYNQEEIKKALYFNSGQVQYTHNSPIKINNQVTESATVSKEQNTMESILDNLENLTKKIGQNESTQIAERILTILGKLMIKLNDGIKNTPNKR